MTRKPKHITRINSRSLFKKPLLTFSQSHIACLIINHIAESVGPIGDDNQFKVDFIHHPLTGRLQANVYHKNPEA